MRNSRPVRRQAAFSALAVAASLSGARVAGAQQVVTAREFAVERFYPSAPGGGWFVMDDLDLHGGLGGAVSVTGGYAHDPLVLTDPTHRVPVVSDQAFFDVGLAVTYDRFRVYLNLASPLSVQGESGTVGNTSFIAPAVGVGSNPDTVSDVRLGFDARLAGEPEGPFRLGVGAQLIVPSGAATGDDRRDYLSDGTYRAMGRVLVAGNLGIMTYAGQLGVHVRPASEPTPGGPRGSELLFGVAVGPRIPLDGEGHVRLVVGPEVFGESALDASFGKTTTGLEALLTSRIEGAGDAGPQLRGKLGVGGGLAPAFGAPEWRVLLGVELFEQARGLDAAPLIPRAAFVKFKP